MSIYDAWTAEAVCPGQVLTREKLDAYTVSRFNELLTHARAHAAFYQRYPERVDSLTQVEALPAIDAETIKEEGHRMLCVSQGEIDRILTVESSGTTGKPKRLYFTGEDLEATLAFFARGFLELIAPGDVALVLLPCFREHSVGTLIGKALERISVKPVLCGPLASFEEMCGLIAAEHVNCVAGLPLQVLSLARYSVARGYDVKMKSLLISGDYLPDFVFPELRRLWRCEPFNHYGLAESGLGLALECGAHNGLHVREREIYVEILDEAGRRVPDGTWGEMTLTTLMRRGMPLIRYRTGDKARVLPGSCACGSILKRLDQVAGRIRRLAEDLSIHGVDEAIFPLSGDIVDLAAGFRTGKLELTLVTKTPDEALKAAVLQRFPHAVVQFSPAVNAKPVCPGKRAFLPL